MLSQRYTYLLENIYQRLNRRRYVHPDPLEFLYNYDDLCDREVVAMVASSLAYGRVRQILKSVAAVLEQIGPEPARYLRQTRPSQLRRSLVGFKHRFTTGEHIAAMLIGIRKVTEQYGSLKKCFCDGFRPDDETVLSALRVFVGRITQAITQTDTRVDAHSCFYLLPSPARGSACKRLNLFLRWMVRCDDVDPGGWTFVEPSKLIIPLDTHMHKIALNLGATQRKTADMQTALQITDAFRQITPDDPARYDFALTRFGIRLDMDIAALFNRNGSMAEVYAHA